MRYEMLDLIRLFAIALVLNSHCDRLYPISALATGGAIGNGLFFILSGYFMRIPRENGAFPAWYGKRIARMYPGLWIVVALELLLGTRIMENGWQAVQYFIWPTAFWFVGAIALFCPLLYLLEKLRFREHFGLFTVVTVILWQAWYMVFIDKSAWNVEEAGLLTPSQWYKLIYCFYIFALGFYMRQSNVLPQKGSAGAWAAAAGASFILFFVFKLALDRVPGLMVIQHVSQLLVCVFAAIALIAALKLEKAYVHKIPNRLRKFISACSAFSLEMYLVQFVIIRLIADLGVPFPLNLAAVILICVGLAFLLSIPDKAISRLLTKGKKQAGSKAG